MVQLSKAEKWYHKSVKEFPLARETKTKLQLALSKMTKRQIKDTIKTLGVMEYDCLEKKAEIEWEKFGKWIINKETKEKVFEEIPWGLRNEFKMAAYCKFCRQVAENYLKSLEIQKKV